MRAPEIPGRAGAIGPFPRQYDDPHVYARDIHSGAGNCVCNRGLGDAVHTEAAPGVPVPGHLRPFTTWPAEDAAAYDHEARIAEHRRAMFAERSPDYMPDGAR